MARHPRGVETGQEGAHGKCCWTCRRRRKEGRGWGWRQEDLKGTGRGKKRRKGSQERGRDGELRRVRRPRPLQSEAPSSLCSHRYFGGANFLAIWGTLRAQSPVSSVSGLTGLRLRNKAMFSLTTQTAAGPSSAALMSGTSPEGVLWPRFCGALECGSQACTEGGVGPGHARWPLLPPAPGTGGRPRPAGLTVAGAPPPHGPGCPGTAALFALRSLDSSLIPHPHPRRHVSPDRPLLALTWTQSLGSDPISDEVHIHRHQGFGPGQILVSEATVPPAVESSLLSPDGHSQEQAP